MLRLIPETLTAEAFRPFGEVLEGPDLPGRTSFDGALANRRPGARPNLSLTLKQPLERLPLRSTVMERHRYSSQSFIPQEAGRWLAVVAPHLASAEGPDMARARCFLAHGGQGLTYGADVWHHPFTVLDRPQRFAVLMWRDGTTDDEQFVEVPEFEIDLGAAGGAG